MDDLHPELFGQPDYLLAPEHMLLKTGSEGGQALVVRGGIIAEVGPRNGVVARNPDLAVHDLPGHVVMPGFIDAHHHLTQSFGKALAFGEPSEIFRRIWVPLEGSLDGEGVYLASKLAALEIVARRIYYCRGCGHAIGGRRCRSRPRDQGSGSTMRARVHL